tara:strand:+ start:409 stop:1677 length:1269 start_codon:yes stop_codon:yes gene_type:complete
MAALTNLIERTESIVPDKNEKEQELVPVYQVESFKPDLESGQLQKLYGTSAMPMFEFARRVQSGEATYNPSNQFDREAAETISALSDQELIEQGLQPDIIKDILLPTASFAGGTVISKAGQLASKAGAAPFAEQLVPAVESFLPSSITGAPPTYSGLTVASGINPTIAKDFGLAANQSAIPTTAFKRLQAANPNFVGTKVVGNPNLMKVSTPSLDLVNASAKSGSVVTPVASQADTSIFGGELTQGYKSGLAQVGTSFALDLGINLLSGMKPKQAVKQSAITTAGTAIGTYFGGPIGGFVGGTVAKVVSGGSVVCTELHEQGEISDSEYRTTNYYNAVILTPTHMKGYHFWGVSVAKKMKKGNNVKFWKAVYKKWNKHANYKLGKGKFSISGFVVAKSLETASLLIGKIYEATLEKRIFANG